MVIDSGMVAIGVTVLLALLALAAASGVLSEKVTQNHKQIHEDRAENKEAHQTIFRKLDEIMARMRGNP